MTVPPTSATYSADVSGGLERSCSVAPDGAFSCAAGACGDVIVTVMVEDTRLTETVRVPCNDGCTKTQMVDFRLDESDR